MQKLLKKPTQSLLLLAGGLVVMIGMVFVSSSTFLTSSFLSESSIQIDMSLDATGVQSALDSLSPQINDTQYEIGIAEQNLTAIEADIAAKSQAALEIMRKIAPLSKALAVNQKSITTLNKQITAQRNTLTKINKDLSNKKIKTATKTNLQRQKTQVTNAIANIQSQITVRQSQMEAQQQEINTLSEENAQLEREIPELDSQKSQLSESIRNMKVSRDEMQAVYDAYAARLVQLQSEVIRDNDAAKECGGYWNDTTQTCDDMPSFSCQTRIVDGVPVGFYLADASGAEMEGQSVTIGQMNSKKIKYTLGYSQEFITMTTNLYLGETELKCPVITMPLTDLMYLDEGEVVQKCSAIRATMTVEEREGIACTGDYAYTVEMDISGVVDAAPYLEETEVAAPVQNPISSLFRSIVPNTYAGTGNVGLGTQTAVCDSSDSGKKTVQEEHVGPEKQKGLLNWLKKAFKKMARCTGDEIKKAVCNPIQTTISVLISGGQKYLVGAGKNILRCTLFG